MMKRVLALAFILICLAAPSYAVDIQVVKGKNSGVKAWLAENHKFPIVSMRFAFQGGSEQDPAAKQGLAALTASALTEGAGPYDAAAFQQQLADRSITLSFSAERDEFDGRLKFLSADKDAAFDLLRLALTQPRFEDADIERLRAQQESGVRSLFSDPNWQARYAMVSQYYNGHPYGQRRLGSLQTLQAITRDDIRAFAKTHLARDNITVAVAGDMTADELSGVLDTVFGDLPARAELKDVPNFRDVPVPSSVLVRRDGTQTSFYFAFPGPKRSDPDYYAADIANYILGGGGFASRLMQDVRDKRGLTYGISTDVAPSQHSSIVIGHASVDNPKGAEAWAAILDTMRKLYDEGPSEKEIAAAKDFLSGNMPLALTSMEKIAQYMVYMQREKLGRDYLDRYGKIIRGVKEADVERVLKRYFNPDKITLSMAGKPQGLNAGKVREPVTD